VGSLGGNQPGKYLVRYAQDDFGVQTTDVEDGYEGYVNAPTPYGLVLIRIVVKNHTDLETVNEFQDEIQVSTVPSPTGPVAPALNLSLFRNTTDQPSANVSLGEVVLRLSAALTSYNQPEVLQDRSWVQQLLTYAGISQGNFSQPPGTNLTVAELRANESVAALLSTAGIIEDLGNNWTQPAPQISGDFQSFYSARYYIALYGYLQLSPSQALYPSYSPPGGNSANLTIGPKQAYLFTFSSKPDLLPTGFWSLTAYDEAQYFVPNALNRYSLGDRSNLTYPDGKLVSQGAKGEFQILLQPADVPPPSNWTSK
jgi:hypothetical protein